MFSFINFSGLITSLPLMKNLKQREPTSFLSLIVLPFPTFGLIHWSQNADIKDLSLMVHDLECKNNCKEEVH